MSLGIWRGLAPRVQRWSATAPLAVGLLVILLADAAVWGVIRTAEPKGRLEYRGRAQ